MFADALFVCPMARPVEPDAGFALINGGGL